MALWNTFQNPAAGSSLFERMGVAGYGRGGAGAGTGATDASAPRALLDGAIDASRSQAAAGVASGQSGLQAILADRPAIDRAVGDMRGAADAMIPIADTMRGEGDALFDSGTKVTEQALSTLGIGMGFINMDVDASPLVAEAVRLYDEAFDPDKYVASAAQDVQKSADNAQGQMQRSLARQGVNPSSGAAQAQLQRLFQNSLATMKAAAMTRARERGLADKASAFQSLLAGNANTFLQTGGQLASIGTSARAHGIDAQQGATSVLGNAGNLFGNAGELGLNYNKTLMGAHNALAGRQLDQARNTLDGEQLRVSAVNGTGGGVIIIDNTDRAIQARLAAGMNPVAK